MADEVDLSDFSGRLKNPHEDSTVFFCVSVSALMSLIVWLRLFTKKFQPVFLFTILLITYFAALVLRQYDRAAMLDESYDMVPIVAMDFCLPLFLFYSSMGTDFSELSLNAGCTILYLITFNLVVALCSAFLIAPLLAFSSHISFPASLLLVVVLTPKWVIFAVNELDHVQGHIRDTQMMLKFEQLCSTWFAYVFVELLFSWQFLQTWPRLKAWNFVIVVLYKSTGLIIGSFIAVFIRIPFSFAYNDIPVQAIIILSAIYVVQLLTKFIGASPGLAVGIFGISLNSNRIKMSKAAEEFHSELWEWYIFLAKIVVGIMAGLVLGLKRGDSTGFFHAGIVIIIYCVLLTVRLIVLTITRNFVLKQNDIYWKRVVIQSIGPYHGAPCTALALTYFIHDEREVFLLLSYVIGVQALSVFFNGMLFRTVLKILGMFEYKRATIVNMNVAVSQINSCREKAIFAQKMDQVITDANWPIVDSLTRLPHPYRKRLQETGYAEDKGDFRLRTIICPSCGMEVVAPPTKGEIDDMISEAKQRVLKIQLVSFSQQYENGTITRHSYRTLFSAIDAAANSGNPVIDSDSLNIKTQESKATRLLRRLFTYLTAVTNRTYLFIPENIFRLIAYRMVTSRAFNISMAVLALVDTAIISRLIYVWFTSEINESGNREFTDKALEYGRVSQILDIAFYLIFMLEFIAFLMGIGTIQYFASHLNKIEFGANLVRTAELVMYLRTITTINEFISVLLTQDVIIGMKCILCVRVVRVYVFVIGWLPKCLALVEKQVEDELMKNYEIGKGYLVSLERVMKFLSHVAIYETVYEALKNEIEEERKKVARDLGLIQKENPSIAITVKTKHAIRFVINAVAECINDLKEDGILDFNENKAINDSLEKVRNDLRELPMVDPSLAQGVLRDVMWLNQNDEHIELVLSVAKLTSYDYNDRLINVGDDPTGLYVLVSGLVKAYYNPTSTTVQLNTKFGVLPNFDFFEIVKFDQPQDTYVVAGNVIGEIGAVTGRRYDMTVVCETSVQLYYIEWSVIRAIVHESEDAIEIQNSIWKCIGMRLGVILLQTKPQFSDWPKEKLIAYLDNGWVPPLNEIKCINIHEDVQDMVLIEGVCKDPATYKIFTGPCQLPKGLKLLYLPDHPSWLLPTVYSTKILIIPGTTSLTNIAGDLFKDHYKLNMKPPDAPFSKKAKVGFGQEDRISLSTLSTTSSLSSRK